MEVNMPNNDPVRRFERLERVPDDDIDKPRCLRGARDAETCLEDASFDA
jgi:hypothetical protein